MPGWPEKAIMFVESPEVGGIVPQRLEDEMPSVRRPLATAFVGRGFIPPRKQGVKIGSIDGYFPNGAVIGLGIVDGKPQNRAVR